MNCRSSALATKDSDLVAREKPPFSGRYGVGTQTQLANEGREKQDADEIYPDASQLEMKEESVDKLFSIHCHSMILAMFVILWLTSFSFNTTFDTK